MPKLLGKFEIGVSPLNRSESFGGVPHYGVTFHDPEKKLTLIGWLPCELFDELPKKFKGSNSRAEELLGPKKDWVATFRDNNDIPKERRPYNGMTEAAAASLAKEYALAISCDNYTIIPKNK